MGRYLEHRGSGARRPLLLAAVFVAALCTLMACDRAPHETSKSTGPQLSKSAQAIQQVLHLAAGPPVKAVTSRVARFLQTEPEVEVADLVDLARALKRHRDAAVLLLEEALRRMPEGARQRGDLGELLEDARRRGTGEAVIILSPMEVERRRLIANPTIPDAYLFDDNSVRDGRD